MHSITTMTRLNDFISGKRFKIECSCGWSKTADKSKNVLESYATHLININKEEEKICVKKK